MWCGTRQISSKGTQFVLYQLPQDPGLGYLFVYSKQGSPDCQDEKVVCSKCRVTRKEMLRQNQSAPDLKEWAISSSGSSVSFATDPSILHLPSCVPIFYEIALKTLKPLPPNGGFVSFPATGPKKIKMEMPDPDERVEDVTGTFDNASMAPLAVEVTDNERKTEKLPDHDCCQPTAEHLGAAKVFDPERSRKRGSSEADMSSEAKRPRRVDVYPAKRVCSTSGVVSYVYVLPNDKEKCYLFYHTVTETQKLHSQSKSFTVVCSRCYKYFQRTRVSRRDYPGYTAKSIYGSEFTVDPTEGHVEECQPLLTSQIFKKFQSLEAQDGTCNREAGPSKRSEIKDQSRRSQEKRWSSTNSHTATLKRDARTYKREEEGASPVKKYKKELDAFVFREKEMLVKVSGHTVKVRFDKESSSVDSCHSSLRYSLLLPSDVDMSTLKWRIGNQKLKFRADYAK